MEEETAQCWSIVLAHFGVSHRDRPEIAQELINNLSLADIFEQFNFGELIGVYLEQHSPKFKANREDRKAVFS